MSTNIQSGSWVHFPENGDINNKSVGIVAGFGSLQPDGKPYLVREKDEIQNSLRLASSDEPTRGSPVMEIHPVNDDGTTRMRLEDNKLVTDVVYVHQELWPHIEKLDRRDSRIPLRRRKT